MIITLSVLLDIHCNQSEQGNDERSSTGEPAAGDADGVGNASAGAWAGRSSAGSAGSTSASATAAAATSGTRGWASRGRGGCEDDGSATTDANGEGGRVANREGVRAGGEAGGNRGWGRLAGGHGGLACHHARLARHHRGLSCDRCCLAGNDAVAEVIVSLQERFEEDMVEQGCTPVCLCEKSGIRVAVGSHALRSSVSKSEDDLRKVTQNLRCWKKIARRPQPRAETLR
jgi:hypothetical protein